MKKSLFYFSTIILMLPGLVSAQANQFASLDFIQTGKNQVAIRVDSGKNAINAVGVIVKFDPKNVKVKDLNFDQSFCLLFIEKIFDNTKGEIRISCGLPNPGIKGQGNVAVIEFENISDFLELHFDKDCQVLANDGFGTEVLGQTHDFILGNTQTSPSHTNSLIDINTVSLPMSVFA